MTSDDALMVEAHKFGLHLDRYGADPVTLTRVGEHLAALPRGEGAEGGSPRTPPVSVSAAMPVRDTRATRFNARCYHDIVVSRSRRAFTNGLHQDAVLRAFRSVNNRVKTLTRSSRDGKRLMAWAFGDVPQLQLSELDTESEQNEHEGTRFMMMGAIVAMRNPRAHEDHWARDDDEAYVLDALAFASFLHRVIDIAEAHG